MCPVLCSKKERIISQDAMNQLVFVTERQYVFYETGKNFWNLLLWTSDTKVSKVQRLSSLWSLGIKRRQKEYGLIKVPKSTTNLSNTNMPQYIIIGCLDKPTRCNTSYAWSLLSINWIYIFRTITSPSSGASSHELYKALVCLAGESSCCVDVHLHNS